MRIVVIDDHVLFRRCIVEYLEGQSDVTVVGQASSRNTALDIVKDVQPDVSLVDIDLGGADGLALAREIIQTQKSSAVVILTASSNEQDMLAALEMGASGYLVKNIEPQALCNALQSVLGGEPAFPRAFLVNQVRSSLQGTMHSGRAAPRVALTDREMEILQLVADGLMDKEIAYKLSVSENTVKKHMQSVRNKLGVANRLQASLAAIRLGLIVDRGD